MRCQNYSSDVDEKLLLWRTYVRRSGYPLYTSIERKQWVRLLMDICSLVHMQNCNEGTDWIDCFISTNEWQVVMHTITKVQPWRKTGGTLLNAAESYSSELETTYEPKNLSSFVSDLWRNINWWVWVVKKHWKLCYKVRSKASRSQGWFRAAAS